MSRGSTQGVRTAVRKILSFAHTHSVSGLVNLQLLPVIRPPH